MKPWDDRSSEYKANHTSLRRYPLEPARGCAWGTVFKGILWVILFAILAFMVTRPWPI
jgi:hypothetical protein